MDIESLKGQLMLHEGLRLCPYKCTAGKLTIGVGHNMDDNPLPGYIQSYLDKYSEITHNMAMTLLEQDIEVCAAQLDRHLPWWSTMKECRQHVILDMCFNLGIQGLLGFKNTLKFIEAHEYAKASENMMKSKWAKQVGNRAVVLAQVMKSGKDYTR